MLKLSSCSFPTNLSVKLKKQKKETTKQALHRQTDPSRLKYNKDGPTISKIIFQHFSTIQKKYK